MTPRIREILSWYEGENPGILTNLARMLNHGRLGGTGRMLILPVDQGFEHGPGRSFAMNPPAYSPLYHYEMAIEAGLSAYAAPLGFLEAGAAQFAGEIPLILKCNNHDLLHKEADPVPAMTAGVEDALRLGCVAVGFTIYPGSEHRVAMYEQLRELAADAKAAGLAVVVWSYPRGSDLSKAGETAIDICAYLELPEAKAVYEQNKVPIATQAERVHHVVQSAFDGRRIVIFSGGEAKPEEEALLEEMRAIRDGGGFGSIIGRNTFQRKKPDALRMLGDIIKIYAGQMR
jgi:class I fructose-bisphosphate aldolase